jgi:hypothetical protein
MTNGESRMTKETPNPKAEWVHSNPCISGEFIEIKRWLKEGEVVLLRPPGGAETETGGSPKPTETKPTAPAEKSAPPPAGKATAGVLPCHFGTT